MTDSGCRLDLRPKGFGIFATGVGYYAPVSVMALLRYLAEKRASDSAFLASLGKACALCGDFYSEGQITLTNHAQLTLSALALSGALHLEQPEEV